MWIIQRVSDGQYVARPRRRNSYTKMLQWAWEFPTEAEAAREACDNEQVTLAAYAMAG